jgi:hypothetical protein
MVMTSMSPPIDFLLFVIALACDCRTIESSETNGAQQHQGSEPD